MASRFTVQSLGLASTTTERVERGAARQAARRETARRDICWDVVRRKLERDTEGPWAEFRKKPNVEYGVWLKGGERVRVICKPHNFDNGHLSSFLCRWRTRSPGRS